MGLCIYHSGDTVPFPALTDLVRVLAADVALLPVNGRDTVRLAAGIPGNLTLNEAISLAQNADIPLLIPHHFGMFAFNTCEESEIDAAAVAPLAQQLVKPVPGDVIFLRE